MRGTCGTKFTHGEFKTLAAMFNMSGELNTILIPPASRLIGYACVSTDDQDLSLQLDALTRAGMPANSIFMDKISRAQTERLGLRTHATPTLGTCRPRHRGRQQKLAGTLRSFIQQRPNGLSETLGIEPPGMIASEVSA